MSFTSPDPPDRPDPGSSSPATTGATRRAFLATAGFGLGALTLAGRPPAASAAQPRFIEDAFAGLAAFVLPGNDAYSKRQGKTYPGPGAVAAGAGMVVRESLDIAIPVQLGREALPAPGALGYALILKIVALNIDAFSIVGPFANPFANLTWIKKREVLQRVEDLPGIKGSLIGYSANALSTIAGLGAYGERSAFSRTTGKLLSRPVSWDYSNYGGRSDGWPEFTGFLDGVTDFTTVREAVA